jgi:hypothetical protein
VVGPDGLVERPASRSKRSGRKVALSPYCVSALVAHREKQTEIAIAAGTPMPVNAFIFSAHSDCGRGGPTRRTGSSGNSAARLR